MLLINLSHSLKGGKGVAMYGYEEMLKEEEIDRLEDLASLVGNNMDAVANGLEKAEFVSLEDLDTSWLDIDIDLLDILF